MNLYACPTVPMVMDSPSNLILNEAFKGVCEFKTSLIAAIHGFGNSTAKIGGRLFTDVHCFSPRGARPEMVGLINAIFLE